MAAKRKTRKVRRVSHARAKAWAKKMGYELRTQYEQERYRDVYGDDPPEGVDFVTVALVDPETNDVLQSVGFVEDDRRSIDEEFGNLAQEAMLQHKSKR
jgi:hypothetical protein